MENAIKSLFIDWHYEHCIYIETPGDTPQLIFTAKE